MATGTRSKPPRTIRDDDASAPGAGGQRWWWIALVGIVIWNVISLLPLGGQALDIPYSTFLSQVRARNVASVAFDGQTVSGTFRTPIAPPAADGSAEARTAPSPARTPAPRPSAAPGAATQTYAAFRTIVPPQGDPALIPALERGGVEISADESSGPAFPGDLLIGLLPIALLIGVGMIVARQVQRTQQGIFGFGGSRARLYTAERPGVTFGDVAGADDAKEELREIVDFLRDPEHFRRLGARLPRGVLLIGPPGSGKTLLARAVAGEARTPFFSISASEFVEMFVGVGASRVRDLFAKAKASAPSIVFVDEIDAVGRQRGVGLSSNDEREQTLNQLLVEMDGFDAETNVIVIAATNRPDVLDAALMRPGRFDRQVTVGYPDRGGREAILRIHTRRLPLDRSVDLAELARQTPSLSGAELANLANEAALVAAREGAPAVRRVDFLAALDKITLGTRQPGLQDAAERRLVAYHEGGHALVALSIPGSDPVEKVTIVPHGRALGVTQQVPEEDRRNYSRGYLMGRLAVMLAGRAAEELIFGEPTTGAESDLQQATVLARQMVVRWGMSDAIGAVWLAADGESAAGPPDPRLAHGERTAARIESAVEEILNEAGLRAQQILVRRRAALDAVAHELLEHENIERGRLAQIVGEEHDRAPSTGGRAVRVPSRQRSLPAVSVPAGH
jgi:cell division protease FtsH